MSAPAFTPGPWHFTANALLGKGTKAVLVWSATKHQWETCGPDGLLVSLADQPANLHLIQAAPSLYATLEDVARLLKCESIAACDLRRSEDELDDLCDQCKARREIEAQLRKARGERLL